MREFLEDYSVGDEASTFGRTITETDFVIWGGIEHDYPTIHFDAHKMRASTFGERIAAGYIPLNLSVGMFAQSDWNWYWPAGAIATLGWDDVIFHRPLLIGDTIQCRREIREVIADEESSGVLVHLVEIHNQGSELVMSGHERVKVRRRPQ